MTVLAHTGEVHPLQFVALGFAVLLPALALVVAVIVAGGKK